MLESFKQSRIFNFLEDETKIDRFNETLKIVQEFTEHSTIQGLESIFASTQTRFSKTFWSVVVLSMLSLGIDWSVKMYSDWDSNQVLTTITTTGVSFTNNLQTAFCMKVL